MANFWGEVISMFDCTPPLSHSDQLQEWLVQIVYAPQSPRKPYYRKKTTPTQELSVLWTVRKMKYANEERLLKGQMGMGSWKNACGCTGWIWSRLMSYSTKTRLYGTYADGKAILFTSRPPLWCLIETLAGKVVVTLFRSVINKLLNHLNELRKSAVNEIGRIGWDGAWFRLLQEVCYAILKTIEKMFK